MKEYVTIVSYNTSETNEPQKKQKHMKYMMTARKMIGMRLITITSDDYGKVGG